MILIWLCTSARGTDPVQISMCKKGVKGKVRTKGDDMQPREKCAPLRRIVYLLRHYIKTKSVVRDSHRTRVQPRVL